MANLLDKTIVKQCNTTKKMADTGSSIHKFSLLNTKPSFQSCNKIVVVIYILILS